MARLFDANSYALATSLAGTTQIPVKRAGQAEIERATLATVATALAPILIADEGLSTKIYVDGIDDKYSQETNQLKVRVGANEASITNIYQTHATTIYADAKKTEAIAAATAASIASILTTLQAYATISFAEAKKTEAITVATANANASIASTLSAYATQTFAETKKTEAINVAVASALASVNTLLQAYVTEAAALVLKTEAITAAVGQSTAAFNTALTAYATKTETATAKTEAISASNGHANSIVSTQAAATANALGQLYGFWGVNINNAGQIVGAVRLDGTNATSRFTLSVDALTLSDPSAPTTYFRTTSRAVGARDGHTFGAGTAFSWQPSTPAVLYGPAHPQAAANPGNIVAVREGIITVLIVAHIPTTGGFVTVYYRVDNGPYTVLGSFTAGNKPVTLARGSDAFYGIADNSKIEFYVAPCNGAGVIAADTPEATDPQTTAIDVLAFNL